MFKAASSSGDSKGRFFLSSCCNFGVVIGRSALVYSPVASLYVIYRHVKSVPGVFWNEAGWRSRRRLRERPGIQGVVERRQRCHAGPLRQVTGGAQGVVIAARFPATNRRWLRRWLMVSSDSYFSHATTTRIPTAQPANPGPDDNSHS